MDRIEELEIPEGFSLTGERRVPQLGEWYLYNQGCAAWMEGPASTSPVWILRKVTQDA